MVIYPQCRPTACDKPCLHFSSLLIACVAIVGCGISSPPTDTNGKAPDDVVRDFLDAVHNKDYESARRLWYGNSKLVFDAEDGKADLREPFEEFCAMFASLDPGTVEISRPQRGKSGFWLVSIDWNEQGGPKHDQFGLKIVDGEWKMERGYYW